nr:hypothetical protein CFP56_19350 [Quercus suber]
MGSAALKRKEWEIPFHDLPQAVAQLMGMATSWLYGAAQVPHSSKFPTRMSMNPYQNVDYIHPNIIRPRNLFGPPSNPRPPKTRPGEKKHARPPPDLAQPPPAPPPAHALQRSPHLPHHDRARAPTTPAAPPTRIPARPAIRARIAVAAAVAAADPRHESPQLGEEAVRGVQGGAAQGRQVRVHHLRPEPEAQATARMTREDTRREGLGDRRTVRTSGRYGGGSGGGLKKKKKEEKTAGAGNFLYDGEKET